MSCDFYDSNKKTLAIFRNSLLAELEFVDSYLTNVTDLTISFEFKIFVPVLLTKKIKWLLCISTQVGQLLGQPSVEVWTLKLLAVNKSINLRTTNGKRIDLAQKFVFVMLS